MNCVYVCQKIKHLQTTLESKHVKGKVYESDWAKKPVCSLQKQDLLTASSASSCGMPMPETVKCSLWGADQLWHRQLRYMKPLLQETRKSHLIPTRRFKDLKSKMFKVHQIDSNCLNWTARCRDMYPVPICATLRNFTMVFHRSVLFLFFWSPHGLESKWNWQMTEQSAIKCSKGQAVDGKVQHPSRVAAQAALPPSVWLVPGATKKRWTEKGNMEQATFDANLMVSWVAWADLTFQLTVIRVPCHATLNPLQQLTAAVKFSSFLLSCLNCSLFSWSRGTTA